MSIKLSNEMVEAQRACEKAFENVKETYSKSRNKSFPQQSEGSRSEDLGSIESQDAIIALTPDTVMPCEDEGEGESKMLEPESVSKDLNDAGLNAPAAFYINLGDLKRQEGRSFSEALAAYNISLKLGGESCSCCPGPMSLVLASTVAALCQFSAHSMFIGC